MPSIRDRGVDLPNSVYEIGSGSGVAYWGVDAADAYGDGLKQACQRRYRDAAIEPTLPRAAGSASEFTAKSWFSTVPCALPEDAVVKIAGVGMRSW